MRNFLRICTAVLVIGGVLCAAGAAAGGRLYSTIQGGVLRPVVISLPRLRVEREDGTVGAAGDGRSGAGRSGGSAWEPPSAALDGISDLPDTPDGVMGELSGITSLKKLDFELGMGDYTIVVGDCYGLDYEGSWIDSDITNGVWKIRTDDIFSNLLGGGDRECTITIPAGCTVETLDWEIGAANVEVQAPIVAQKADFEVGAGNLELLSLTVTDKIDAEVSAGSLSLGLTGSWSDYLIKADVAMGSITINGVDLISGLAGSCEKGAGHCRIKADLGMGSIDIRTETE